MAIYRVDYVRTYTKKYVMVDANSRSEAISKAIKEDSWQRYPVEWIPAKSHRYHTKEIVTYKE